MTSPNYANETSFRVYVDYLALKRHFTTDNYDYHKYNGKVKASFNSFKTRNDAFFFFKLSQKDDWHERLLSNLVEKPDSWIRSIIEESGEEIYYNWVKRRDSLTYIFKNDLEKLKEDYVENFKVVEGQHPYFLTLYLNKSISFETFTVLLEVSNSYEYLDKNMVDKFVGFDIIKKSKKYYPFLNADRKKFSSIVKKYFFQR